MNLENNNLPESPATDFIYHNDNNSKLAEYYVSAKNHHEEENYNAAIKNYTDILMLDLDDYETSNAYYYRARTYFLMKEYRKAILDFNEAIQRIPRIECYYFRASSYEKTGAYNLAIADYVYASTQYPFVEETMSCINFSKKCLLEHITAIENHIKARKLEPEDGCLLDRITCYSKMSEYNEIVGNYYLSQQPQDDSG